MKTAKYAPALVAAGVLLLGGIGQTMAGAATRSEAGGGLPWSAGPTASPSSVASEVVPWTEGCPAPVLSGSPSSSGGDQPLLPSPAIPSSAPALYGDVPATSGGPTSSATGSPTASPSGLPDGPAIPWTQPGLGVYNGAAGEDPDQATLQEFGRYPDVADSYYLPDQDIDMAYETARIERGTSPNITIATRGTQLIAGIADGDPTAMAWLQHYVDQLAQLAAVDPLVPVYATIDHEFAVAVHQGLVTGPSADPVTYGKALDAFLQLLHTDAPTVCGTYWFAGYDRDFEGTVGAQLTVPPAVIEWDPYAHGPGDTIESITADDLAWIKGQPWYVGQPLALGEFGMPVADGDPALGDFYTGIRESFSQLGISWGVFFNRERDNDHQIVARSDGRAFPQAVTAFRESIDQ